MENGSTKTGSSSNNNQSDPDSNHSGSVLNALSASTKSSVPSQKLEKKNEEKEEGYAKSDKPANETAIDKQGTIGNEGTKSNRTLEKERSDQEGATWTVQVRKAIATEDKKFDYEAFRQELEKNVKAKMFKECERQCLAKVKSGLSRPIVSKLHNHLGELYEHHLEDKLFDDILERYILALQYDESNAKAHVNLGRFLIEQGKQHLHRALELGMNLGNLMDLDMDMDISSDDDSNGANEDKGHPSLAGPNMPTATVHRSVLAPSSHVHPVSNVELAFHENHFGKVLLSISEAQHHRFHPILVTTNAWSLHTSSMLHSSYHHAVPKRWYLWPSMLLCANLLALGGVAALLGYFVYFLKKNSLECSNFYLLKKKYE
ncbi:hypothetical protein RFI_28281 [Reticulomyxa filosa]|uniref:Uncharacterized protein n=1 Tax=Reticulomyxa filosa TaxID=46433 RepID=X6M628_RETFI|nr:hypothetical protein RFI_28281 [Reticulomyxa filosa]|eukprot:ETO09106.1 hypothetical protein RFI_28281 [Reticulomyxa filosa]